MGGQVRNPGAALCGVPLLGPCSAPATGLLLADVQPQGDVAVALGPRQESAVADAVVPGDLSL